MEELKRVVLAALLHDVGKFAQRAKRPYSKDMEGEYLTNFKGKAGHWHTVYTDYFIENDLPLPKDIREDRSRIARMASAHHKPNHDDAAEMSIMIADRLSSGEREEHAHSEEPPSFREARLVSVFDQVQMGRHEFNPPGEWFHRLVPLDPQEDQFFPIQAKASGDPDEYAALFDSFMSDIEKISQDLPFDLYLEALATTLESYTWCIPSSTYKTLADISLYDHGFTTASIAQALFLFHKNKGTAPRKKDEEDKFIILGGDLSGIQDYIFGISKNSGRGVSKIFRARSFYLQAVVRSVILSICQRLGVHGVCRLMDSGGKFMLLLPLLPEVQEKLSVLEKEVHGWFKGRFKGLLSMSLSWQTTLSQKDFEPETFRKKLDQTHDALEVAKLKKLNTAIANDGPVIAEDYDEREGGNCTICGYNPSDVECTESIANREGQEISLCRECFQQIVEIGANLPKKQYYTYADKGDIALFGGVYFSMHAKPPAHFQGVLAMETPANMPGVAHARIARSLPSVTEEELMDNAWFSALDAESEDIPLELGRIKTFGMIASKAKKKSGDELIGRALLGFMKADVDNLGLAFSMGLGDRLSVARFSFLSRMLSFFFSDYLTTLCEKRFPDIYTVFAGGDDLFMVGPWNQALEFALRVREDFAKFCGNNPDLTLSAAVMPAKPRLPMRKAAALVKDWLDKAKESSPEKDKLCFLEEAFSWEVMKDLIEQGKFFEKAMEEKDRTRFTPSFVYRLLEYQRMYKRFIRENKIRFGRYLSHAHYDIGRNIADPKGGNQAEVDVLYSIFAVGAESRPLLDNLHVPLYYAINRNRKE